MKDVKMYLYYKLFGLSLIVLVAILNTFSLIYNAAEKHL